MSRQIRRVPVGWEHPKRERLTVKGGHVTYEGEYVPLKGGHMTYEEKLGEWVEQYLRWKRGEDEGVKQDEPVAEFIDYYGNPPHIDDYMPTWTEEQLRHMGYCIYEEVSDGTPVSPVFETEDEMFAWLVRQGHSEQAARRFIKEAWAPSLVMIGGRIEAGIDSLDMLGGGSD